MTQANLRSGPPLVEIRNATIFRGATQVFDRLDLTIDQGEHVALLGPNGAGKTTLIKALNRELYPRADEDTVFRILGQATWNVWALRRQLGIVSAELQHRYREQTFQVACPSMRNTVSSSARG